MTDLENLLKEIIPYPADHSHREGFTNEHIIDSLNKEDKFLVEKGLIDLLNKNPWDTFIVETLAYMKSNQSLPILKRLLKKGKHGFDKLSIATSIYEICQDNDMIDIAIKEFERFENNIGIFPRDNIMASFYYLSRFHNYKTNYLIGKYLDHWDYLVSYNAKRFFVENKDMAP
jgi:hypothetical protein